MKISFLLKIWRELKKGGFLWQLWRHNPINVLTSFSYLLVSQRTECNFVCLSSRLHNLCLLSAQLFNVPLAQGCVTEGRGKKKPFTVTGTVCVENHSLMQWRREEIERDQEGTLTSSKLPTMLFLPTTHDYCGHYNFSQEPDALC